MKCAVRCLPAILAGAIGLHACAAPANGALDPTRAHDARVARTESGPSPEARNFVARFRAAAAEPGATALADLSALPFLYEGRRLARDEFMREAVPALFTPAVRRCLQRAPAQSEGERLVLWCKPYGFHLGPLRGHWHLIEFVADVD